MRTMRDDLRATWPQLPPGRLRADTVGPAMTAFSRSMARHRDPSWDVDRHVGARLRARRLALGLTQQEFARLIGVTYQQAQKYEAGANRMTAERLFTVAQALGVSVDYFFENYGARRPAGKPAVGGIGPAMAGFSRGEPHAATVG
jgi:DNA-binding transcriptional regulator YiaG